MECTLNGIQMFGYFYSLFRRRDIPRQFCCSAHWLNVFLHFFICLNLFYECLEILLFIIYLKINSISLFFHRQFTKLWISWRYTNRPYCMCILFGPQCPGKFLDFWCICHRRHRALCGSLNCCNHSVQEVLRLLR